MIKLPLYISSCHLFCKDDWTDCLKRAREIGFDGIELFGGEKDVPFEKMPDGRLKEIAYLADNLSVSKAMHPWTDWTRLSGEKMEEAYLRLAERCAFMGVKYLNMHMEFLSSREDGMERVFHATDRVLPVIRDAGMILLYEDVPDHGNHPLGSDYEDFASLFSRYGKDSPVRMNIDTGHAHIMKHFESLARDYGDRWVYTHINDNHGHSDEHIAPGDGTVNFFLAAQLSKNAGYEGPLMMEFHESGLEKGMRTLTEAYGEAGYRLEYR